MSVEFIITVSNNKNIKISSTISACTWRADTNMRESRTCAIGYINDMQVVICDDAYCYDDDGIWAFDHTSVVETKTNKTLYSGEYLAMDSLIDELATC